MNNNYYIFNWNDVPGKDSKHLIDHLAKCFELHWIQNAEITKSDDNKSVTITDGETSLTLTLTERKEAVLDLGDEKAYIYGVQAEDEHVFVYAKDVFLILRELDSEDDEGLENLASSITKRSWKTPRAIVRILHSDDEDDVSKARAILLCMADIGFTPLLDSLSPDVPETYAWDMQTLVGIQLEHRGKIAKVLETMLADTRPLKMPDLAPDTEESFVPRRVCDEAYLMLHRLLALEEGEEEQFCNATDFLNMPDDEKDAEISRAKTSKRWIPLVEQF